VESENSKACRSLNKDTTDTHGAPFKKDDHNFKNSMVIQRSNTSNIFVIKTRFPKFNFQQF
jgi:hypothetical protein